MRRPLSGGSGLLASATGDAGVARSSGSFAAIVCIGCGAVLVIAASCFDAAWFDRHSAVPCFWPAPRPWVHPAVRICLALAGLGCVAAAPIAGRVLRRPFAVARAARIAAALGLAVVLSEGVLRLLDGKTTIWRAPKIEFRIGTPDARYGWVLRPRRTTVLQVKKSRPVRYTIDAWGDRAATVDHVPDLSRPTILVAGESVAMGHGLEYADTLGSVLERDLGIQVVNVAVGGYGTDQAALRALDMLARLEHPVAVVQTFLPVQLQRNVQDYRPRLVLRDGSLVLLPAASGPFAGTRLRDLLVNELPVLWEDKLQESLAVTAAVVREVAAKSRARGAMPLFLVPGLDSQRGLEWLVQTLFEDQGIPVVVAKVDSARIMPYDGHPDAEATRAMAGLVEHALGLQVRVAR